MKECLNEKGVDVRKARRMVQDRSEWRGFVRGMHGRSPGNKPLTLTICQSCGFPQLNEALEGWKSVYGRAYNLKGIKWKISIFLFFLKFFLF